MKYGIDNARKSIVTSNRKKSQEFYKNKGEQYDNRNM